MEAGKLGQAMELRSRHCATRQLPWRSHLQIASEASLVSRAGSILPCKRFERSSRLTEPAQLPGVAHRLVKKP